MLGSVEMVIRNVMGWLLELFPDPWWGVRGHGGKVLGCLQELFFGSVVVFRWSWRGHTVVIELLPGPPDQPLVGHGEVIV